MKSLKEQLQAYAAYHQSRSNKITHFFGVPLVTFSLFLCLSWIRFVQLPVFSITAASIFCVCVFVYYLWLDWMVALVQLPFNGVLLFLADRAAVLPFAESLCISAVSFIGGWAIQLAGHAIEGRRPALADNVLQALNAPLFLAVELLTFIGLRKDLLDSPEKRPPEGEISAAHSGHS